MPSQRKRIGFLPSAEVQKIIDQICINNKLSQSKVTGILVEEALASRGMLNSYSINKFSEINCSDNNTLLISDINLDNETKNENEILNLDKSYINEEVKMINNYIEYKFFKNIMNKNKKNI